MQSLIVKKIHHIIVQLKTHTKKVNPFLFIAIFVLLLTVPIILVSQQREKEISKSKASTAPSGEDMPTGDIPGWKQVFTDDFTTDVPLGNFPSAVSDKWGNPINADGSVDTEYTDGNGDTNSRDASRKPGGQYWPSKVVSFHDGMMDMYLHTENGIHMVAAPFPLIPGATGPKQSMQYGRYVQRWKIDSHIPGYKNAWLTWPGNEQLSGGEIDFPETNFGGTEDTTRNPYIDGTYHINAGAYEPGQEVDSTVIPDDWHTTTVEWAPDSIKFILDGQVLRTYTGSLPPGPMYYVLQTETATEGSLPADSVFGHVLIDWVSIYQYAPATVTPGTSPTVTDSLTPTQIPSSSPTPIVGNNLITNPGCETDISGWSGWQGTVSRVTTNPRSGNASCKVTQTTGNVYTIDDVKDVIVPSFGQQYNATAYARTDSSVGKPVFLAIRFSGGSHADNTIYDTTGVKLSTSWQKLTNTVTVDYADRTSLDVYLAEESASGHDAFQADDISLQLVNGSTTITPTFTPSPTPTRTPTPRPVATATPTPSTSNNGLLGMYFTNTSLSGTPTLQRLDPTINFDWGTGSPYFRIANDNFSVRWTGFVQPTSSQIYTFYVKSDDGMRLWINNVLLVNQWSDHSATEYKGSIQLTGGVKYPIKVEYYEHTNSAQVQLRWSAPTIAKQIVPQARLFSQ